MRAALCLTCVIVAALILTMAPRARHNAPEVAPVYRSIQFCRDWRYAMMQQFRCEDIPFRRETAI